MKYPPIFVLGCQRSGTTLLRLILDSHSRIACPPESKFIVQLVNVFEVEQARHGLQSMGFSSEDILARMRRFVESFFEDYCRRKGKARWADKNLHNIDHLETVDAMFEHKAIYIGIVRHGLDVAFSLMDFDWGVVRRRMEGGVPKHVAGASLWRDQNMKLLALSERVGERFHMVRYEDLTTTPELVLRAMFDFLGERWEPRVLAYNDVQHDQGFGDEKAGVKAGIVPNSGRYLEWPEKLRDEAYEAGQPVFRRLGYELRDKGPRAGGE